MANQSHGGTHTVEYRTWQSMKDRCDNPSCKDYHRYGARGIKVYSRWRRSFPAFLAHIGQRPAGAYSIERIDNARGYRPGNVRWATAADQARNRRSTRLTTDAVISIRELHAKGLTQRAIARLYAVCPQTISLVLAGKRWA